MDATRVLGAGIHVGRIVLLLGTVRASRRVREVVGVVNPAVLRVHRVRRLVERQQAVPFGGRVGAVHGLGPVELRIAFRDEVRVEERDVAIGIGVERVVGRVGVQVHHLLVLGEVARLGARVRLVQGLQRLLHHPDAHPLAVDRADDGAAVRLVDGELLVGHAIGGLVRHRDLRRHERTLFSADTIGVAAVGLLGHGLEVVVDVVDAAGGVHPAGLVVEALVDEELSPGQRAVGVQAFFAHHLRFFAEEERGMRIDQQLRLARGGVGAGDGKAVRARGLGGRCVEVGRVEARRAGGLHFRAIKRFELAEVDLLDVAADAALAEAERHPRFELRNHARLHLGVRGQVEVQAVGPAVHQRLEPGFGLRVVGLELHGINEQLHAQVAIDRALALRLGEAALRVDEVGLDAVEVVFSLRVHQPEHDIGVGLGVDVGHAPVVADDGDAIGALLPGGNFRADGRGGRLRRRARGQRKDTEKGQ